MAVGPEPTIAWPPSCRFPALDSVPTAGRFDGCLGVLGALEIILTLNKNSRNQRRPIIVGWFTDRGGCRFSVDMLGSAVATGRIDLEDAYGLKDGDHLIYDEQRLAPPTAKPSQHPSPRRPHRQRLKQYMAVIFLAMLCFVVPRFITYCITKKYITQIIYKKYKKITTFIKHKHA